MCDSVEDNIAETENRPVAEDELCGYTIRCCSYKSKRWACAPFQSCANIKCALLLLCLGQMFQQAVVFGLLSVCISTLERRFELQSTESGFIASAYDIASVLTLMFISFMGENVHKPTWIGWGLFISGTGAVLFSLPHFIAPTYTYVETETFNYCGNVTASDCTQSVLRNYRFLFGVAMGIFGVGVNPLYTYGMTFLDENLTKEQSSLYNGIYFAMAGLGPAVGFLLGGAALEVYTNIGQSIDGIPVNSSGDSWVGAWWLGFLVGGFVLISVSVPFLLLPRHLPGTEKHRIDRNKEVQGNILKKQEETTEKKSAVSQRWADIKLLLKNKTYLFVVLGLTVNSAFIFGFNTFGAKYLESLFNLTPFQSAVIYGISAIIASSGGQLVGGYLVAKYKLKVSGILKLMVWIALGSTLCSLGFFVHCADIDVAGGTVPYFNETSVNQSPLSSCNENCGCSTDRYEPVCGGDGITYFSPCFAGCSTKLNDSVYTDCSCIPSSANITGEGIAYVESCQGVWCKTLIPFIFIVISCFFSSLLTIPMSSQVNLRCVPFNNRSVALALQRAVVLSLGIVPGRILTGVVLDLACVTWSTECGQRGSCRTYQRWDLARNTALLLCAQTAACTVFFILAYASYKPASDDKETKAEDEKITEVNVLSEAEEDEDPITS